MNPSITLDQGPDPEFREWLKNQIKSYNNELSSWHLEARADGYVKFLNILIHDENQERVGGLTARMYWGWLYVDDFFIPAELRGKGLGSQILTMAEEAAVKNGCRRSLLETFSFQAPGFYIKQGYRIIGEIPDYPPGASMIRLMKELE